jgi:hypothetical protein
MREKVRSGNANQLQKRSAFENGIDFKTRKLIHMDERERLLSKQREGIILYLLAVFHQVPSEENFAPAPARLAKVVPPRRTLSTNRSMCCVL